MIDLINKAISRGAKLYASVSGGKDSQAMVKTLLNNNFKIEGLVHADLGSVEWPESIAQCQKLSDWFNIPLHIVTRSDGRGLLEHWRNRMEQLKGQGKPFWSSSANRYCTSDMKRDPINVFFTSVGHNFIISCEGIRADESANRAKKKPLSIRKRKTSSYYYDMTVDQAIENYNPEYRLTLDYCPIFNYSENDVWGTFSLTKEHLITAKKIYNAIGKVPNFWKFHPAYVYGNERVSCMFCVLGSRNDLQTGAKHNSWLLNEMIAMENEGNATFKNGWSLKELSKETT